MTKKNRESGFAEPPSLEEEGDSERENDDDDSNDNSRQRRRQMRKDNDDDDYDDVHNDDDDDGRNVDKSMDISEETSEEQMMMTATSNSGNDVMIASEILMTSTPDAAPISSTLDAIFNSALDNTDDAVGAGKRSRVNRLQDFFLSFMFTFLVTLFLSF